MKIEITDKDRINFIQKIEGDIRFSPLGIWHVVPRDKNKPVFNGNRLSEAIDAGITFYGIIGE